MKLRMFSACVVLLASISFAAAQSNTSNKQSHLIVPASAIEPVQAMVPVPMQAMPAPVVAVGPGCDAGCGSVAATPCATNECGSGTRSLLGRFLIGAGCKNPVGCGNYQTEKTFMFGSCRQFYSPGCSCTSCNFRTLHCPRTPAIGHGSFLSR